MQQQTPKKVGRYRLENLLGKGGMAEVYRATDEKLGRTVAVKMILPAFAGTELFLERFTREARTVAALEHPNILPVYDFGEQDGAPFLVMPYLDGGTMARRIGSQGLEPAIATDWLGQLADALDTAHRAGVLHRDIKPGNVLIDRNDRPVLADFGLARMHDQLSHLTATGMLIGTPLYMAPELAEGGKATPASDRYSLGVLAYCMLSGKTPFDGETPVAVLHQHITAEVPAISELIASLPPETDTFFRQALAKDPESRPGSCMELARSLEASLKPVPWARRTASLTRTIPTPSEVAGDARRKAESRPEAPASPPVEMRRRYTPWIWSVAGLAAIVTMLVIPWGRYFSDRKSTGPYGDARISEQAVDADALSKTEAVDESQDVTVGDLMVPAPAVPPSSRIIEESPEAAGGENRTTPVEPRPTSGTARRESRPTSENRPGPFTGKPELGRLLLEMKQPHTQSERAYLELQNQLGLALAEKPGDETLAKLMALAEGGLAYARGDDASAVEMVRGLRATGNGQSLAVGLPAYLISMVPPEDPVHAWETAVLFGDARHEGIPEVDRYIMENPDDMRARMARAIMLRLHGDHHGAIEQSRQVYHAVEEDKPEDAGLVAQFIGEECSEAQMWEDAVEAYGRAVEHGGRPVSSAGFRGGKIALEKLHDRDLALRLFRSSCNAGNRQACRRVAALEGRRRR